MNAFLRLVGSSIRESWLLCVSCLVALMAFVAFRIWVAAQIDFEVIARMLSEGPLKFVQNLLPVPLEMIASPLGRVAFGFEEFPVILLMGIWTISRGSDCLAGRIQNGAMEMFLAQPVRRLTLVASHSVVTFGGIVVLVAGAWFGSAVGIAVADFDHPPSWRALAPAATNLGGLGVFCFGLSTMTSAFSPTRGRAVGLVTALLLIQLIVLAVARMAPSMQWLESFTILAYYDPTALSLGVHNGAEETRALLWESHRWLYGLGGSFGSIGALSFCYRDVPSY